MAIAGYVTKNAGVADIGTDHGYLPVWLVENNICPFAVLTDLKEGPLRNAWRSVASSVGTNPGDSAPWLDVLFGGYEIRLGEGLRPLARGEVDTVVIAGMGGETIRSILSEDREKSDSFPKYALQPRTNSAVLRAWIKDAGWYVICEDIAREKGKLCEIIVCAPTLASGLLPERDKTCATRYETQDSDPLGLEISNVQLRDRPPLLGAFLERKIATERKIHERTTGSDRADVIERHRESAQRLKRLEETLRNVTGGGISGVSGISETSRDIRFRP